MFTYPESPHSRKHTRNRCNDKERYPGSPCAQETYAKMAVHDPESREMAVHDRESREMAAHDPENWCDRSLFSGSVTHTQIRHICERALLQSLQ